MIDSLLLETMCELRKCFPAKDTMGWQISSRTKRQGSPLYSRTILDSKITVINSLQILKVPEVKPTSPEREPQRKALPATSNQLLQTCFLSLDPTSTNTQKSTHFIICRLHITGYPQEFVFAKPALAYCTRDSLPTLTSSRPSVYILRRSMTTQLFAKAAKS